MCGRAPGPTRQKVYSSHGRTDGFTEIFNSTDLSNSASNRMLHTSQCAVRARAASDAVRGRRVARQLGHSTSQRRFISPARVACRNNFKTSQRSARQRLATAKGRMCDSSTVRRPDQEFTQPGNERFGKFFGAQFFHDRLFPDEMFADLFDERGRRSVPPSVVAVVMVLQRLEGLSDREAVERYCFDARWRYAAGGGGYDGGGWTSFAHSVLVDMRERLRD